MTIGSINGVNLQAATFGMNQAMDSYSRNIQNQIANARKNGNFFDDMLGESQNTGTAGSADMGVLISLSTTKEQIADMKKVRTDLEGKLRTAETDEARESLQEKIDNLTEEMFEKAKETQNTISENRKAEQDKTEEEKENETDDGSEEDKGDVSALPLTPSN